MQKSSTFATAKEKQLLVNAQMAESVDALVSNTSGFTSIPVRPRVWVLKRREFSGLSLFFCYVSLLSICVPLLNLLFLFSGKTIYCSLSN